MATQQTRTGYYRLYQNSKRLFWDPANLMTVSKAWHDKVKQAQERRSV